MIWTHNRSLAGQQGIYEVKDEKFASVKGECETWTRLVIRQCLRLIRKVVSLSRKFPTLDLNIEEKAVRR